MNEAHNIYKHLERHTRLCLFFLCNGSCLMWHFKRLKIYIFSLVEHSYFLKGKRPLGRSGCFLKTEQVINFLKQYFYQKVMQNLNSWVARKIICDTQFDAVSPVCVLFLAAGIQGRSCISADRKPTVTQAVKKIHCLIRGINGAFSWVALDS